MRSEQMPAPNPGTFPRQATRLTAVFGMALALSACNLFDRLATIGSEPPMTTIQNPVANPNYRPVSMPMPAPAPIERSPHSLWRPGARAFFKDQRASRVGDILTVIIDIKDQAQLNNKSTRSRDTKEDNSISKLFGYQNDLDRFFPDSIEPGSLVDIDATQNIEGDGSVKRDETIELRIAALVSQILPNGNLVLYGRQEVRVNFELRELKVAGVIRPEDIESDNSVPYDRIAEARISYGGRGQITDVQQPRYGEQVLDIILPF
jgi:flagellar L-ring protein precursor FlgH